jgi:hypothetical protein
MSAESQHGFHPGAESLSAFAEQALGERERDGVLAHLAVCGRCRQVVALAREAADPVAPPRKFVTRHAWWRNRQIAWISATALAASATLAVYVHVRNVERSAQTARLEPQTATPPAQTATNPRHQDNHQSAPGALSAPPLPPTPERSAKQTHSAEAEHFTDRQPEPGEAQESTPKTAEADAVDQLEPAPVAVPIPRAEAKQAPPEPGRRDSALPLSQLAVPGSEARQKQTEEQRQAEVETSRRRFTSGQAALEDGSVHGAQQAAAPGASETVTVTGAPPLVESAPQPAAAALSAGVPAQWHGSLPIKQIHLPSGLAVVSSTSNGSLMLAIDKAGALFLSDDQGGTWKRVKTQWTGRAVEVTQQFAATSESQTAPAGETEPRGHHAAGAAAPPEPPLIFELLNDKNQAWVSTDGRTWTMK